MKTELTIEESAKLIELGVDAKSASGHTLGVQKYCGDGIYKVIQKSQPIFTLTDILNILPKEITNIAESENLNIVMNDNGALVGYPKFHEKHGCAFTATELIDALNQLLIWYINNGHYNPKNEEK